MKLKFRATMLMIILALVVTFVFFEGLFSYANAKRSADDLSAQVLEQTSERVVQQIEKVLATVTAQDALSHRLMTSGLVRPDDFPGIIAWWQHMLAVNPEITSLYIALEATGESTGVSRLRQGKFTVWQTNRHPQTGRLEVREFWLEDYPRRPYAFDPSRDAPDTRTRPWYTAARERRVPIWTETFRFLGLEQTQNIHGVTHAIPVYRPDGSLAAVVSVDLDVGGLSRFLQSLPVGKTGFAFVVEMRADGRRQVIAHPDAAGLVRTVPTPAGPTSEVVAIEELADRRVPAFMAQVPDDWAGRGTTNIVPVRFTQDGIAYIGRYRHLGGDTLPRWLICTVIPEADVMEGVYRNNRETLLVGALMLLLSVALSLYVAAQVARPLERIARETQAIGLMQVEARPVHHSMVLEVDRLAVATEEMKRSLRSFQKYVPTDLVRSLLASGQEAVLGGERRPVTVYFSDIANFTSIAESRAPEDLVEHLGQYLSALSEPILQSGGTVDKYIGDAIMAFWGAPQRHPAHAAAACTVALRSQELLAVLRRQWEAEGKPLFHARIGLCTGEVVVGNIGSAARLNYTAIGDTVNLASRLEALNKHYGTQILISESTYLEACDAVAARPIAWVAVKGKVRALLVYELLALKKDAGQAVQDLVGLCSQALDSYRERDWSRAILLAEEVLKVRAGDGPTQRLIERCRTYQASPPGPSWDGIDRMDAK